MPDTNEPLLVGTEVTIKWLRTLFEREEANTHLLIQLSEANAISLYDKICIPVRRCYATDDFIERRSSELALTKSEVLATKLPDAGSTMAGDFGEVLTFLYHVATQTPNALTGPKKWRLKQDRTKPAPHSDVLHFLLPSWPTATDQDVILCSEVKTKSTDGGSKPISTSMTDSQKDRTSRLTRTLIWLKERAIGEDLGDVSIPQIDRFLRAIDFPECKKRFFAVSVICGDLIAKEIAGDPPIAVLGHEVILISVPKLYDVYSQVFAAVKSSYDQDATVEIQ